MNAAHNAATTRTYPYQIPMFKQFSNRSQYDKTGRVTSKVIEDMWRERRRYQCRCICGYRVYTTSTCWRRRRTEIYKFTYERKSTTTSIHTFSSRVQSVFGGFWTRPRVKSPGYRVIICKKFPSAAGLTYLGLQRSCSGILRAGFHCMVTDYASASFI